MFTALNASNYSHNKVFYNAEFENILSKFIVCYKQMLIDNIKFKDNENSIRDIILYKYLKDQIFKEKAGITDYLFDPEIPENSGRVDIRIMPVNPFINDNAYYIIECKRINATNTRGTSGLNGEYISEGICRFVSAKYSCYYKTNAMIGFVTAPINIDENVTVINSLINSSFPTSNTTIPLTLHPITSDFNYSYYSTHSCTRGQTLIYHLMLDFSENLLQEE